MSIPDQRPAGAGEPAVDRDGGGAPRDGAGNELRPMTGRMMARLFLVPAAIVAVVITCAAVVTLGFGFIAQAQERPIIELIDRLAASTGEKVGPLLPPREKELWQAALELSRRLEQPGREIPEQDRPDAATRLAAALTRTVAAARPLSEATRNRITFMAIALGRLGQPSAVDPLERMLTDEEPSVRMAGVQGLAELGSLPANRARVAALFPLLHRDDVPEVRLAAAAAIGQIAEPGDAAAIAALREQLVDADEVRWNVALALARLGDAAGKLDLLDVLNREYWKDRQVRDDPNSPRTRPISHAEVSRNLRSALAALDRVHDAEIRSAVEVLTRDADPRVASDAHEALRRMRAADDARPPAGGAG